MLCFISCEICGKRFAKSHHLKAHLNTHNKNNTAKAQSQNHQQTQHVPQEFTDDTQEYSLQVIDEQSQLDDDPNNDNEYVDYLTQSNIITKVSSGTEDDGSESEQLLLYDVDVLNAIKEQNIKRATTKDGQLITITDHQDPIELLTFEDELE